MFRRLAQGVLGLCLLAGCDAGSSSSDPGATSATPAALLGCTVDSPPPVAPGGYYTNGRTVCSADGTPHLFHGVDRPSLEWGQGEHIDASDFLAMADWHANAVRVGLNQDFWLSGAALYNSSYQATVDQVVRLAESAGLDVILDLHWSDRGDLNVPMLHGQNRAGDSDQQQMADVNSIRFWTEVAMKYKDDGHVLFELYNEPNSISWSVWLKGGLFSGYQVVGMQALYDTVRATGANNVVIAGGLSWAFDLSGVGGAPIKGYNIVYASHVYKPQNAQSRWESAFGYLATRDMAPVILTEFGDGSSACTGDWDQQLIQFADERQISWTAWAWYPSGCNFPGLISVWDHTPTLQGQAVQAALLAYDYAPAGNVGSGTAAGAATGEGGASSVGGTGATAGAAGAVTQ